MNAPEVRYARASDGVHIAYQVFGGGRLDIAYVPGQVSHLDLHWQLPTYAAFLRALGGVGRVIMLDRRGIGLSDRLSPGELPPAEVLAEDLGVVLDAALAAPQVVLFGAAEGGQLCALYAASHPERVRGLILYGMAPSVDQEDLAGWEEYLTWMPSRWGSRQGGLRDTREMIPSLSDDDDVVEWAARLQRSAVSPGMLTQLFRVSIALDVREVLPAIGVPTLVLHRTADPAIAVQRARDVAATIPGALLEELPGEDHLQYAGAWGPVVDAVAHFVSDLAGTQAAASTRRLATILFTDIVDSTRMAAELGDSAWRARIGEHDRVTREWVERAGGIYVKSTGDGLMATFDGPARAVRCAQNVADALWQLGLAIRAGVHTGEVEAVSGDLAGIGVHVAARVAAQARPGEVWTSSTVKDLTAGSGLVFEDQGEHELKGVPDRWHLYRVAG